MAPRISIRIDPPEIESMLAEINSKPATATQIVLELFTAMHRSTILEIRGLFNREEITALALYAKTKKPVWQAMASTSVYINDIEEAEKYNSSISVHNANPKAITDKIKKMTSAQVAILQLEIFSFWERKRKYPEHVDFLGRNIPASDIIAARNQQKNPDLGPLIKNLT